MIDTHTHFYDPTRAQDVPWPPRDDKLLYRLSDPSFPLQLLPPYEHATDAESEMFRSELPADWVMRDSRTSSIGNSLGQIPESNQTETE